MGKSTIDLNEYNHIPTVKYRERVAIFCDKFRKLLPNFEDFCATIILNSGQRVWMANHPLDAIEYVNQGLDRGDTRLFKKLYNGKTYHLFYQNEDIDYIDNLIKLFAEERKTFRCYGIHRVCFDCTLVITLGTNEEIDDLEKFYHDTINLFEKMTCEFFDEMIDAFITEMPPLNNTRFATEKNFREFVIKNREVFKPINLTNRDKEILYLSSLGKTAEEIALITDLTFETVSTYRKRVIKKLNAKNLIHAVNLAKLQGDIS